MAHSPFLGTHSLKSGLSFCLICLFASSVALTSSSCKFGNKPTPKNKGEQDEVRNEGNRAETQTEINLPGGKIKPNDQLHLPNTPEGKRLLEHFNIMYGLGPEAESNYQKSLARLRENPKEYVKILVTAYERSEAIAYADRWALLQTLTDLEVPEAAESLIKFAKADLPLRDTSQYDDAISPYNEESILRITAIDGIAKLSTTYDPAALKAMPEFFKHKDPTIRLEAMNRFSDAIRTIRDKSKQERLIKMLPDDFVFELRPEKYPTPGIENPGLKPSGIGKGAPPRKN
ncbi:MAG: HEAT repeat domain-containing protein [Saprospiraceae bacterium]